MGGPQAKKVSLWGKIFISYRRLGGADTSRLIHDYLKQCGYDVYMDVAKKTRGQFNEALYREIEIASDVVVVLTPGSLDHCHEENNWLRIEVSHAIKLGKNVIPVISHGFQWPSEPLPDDMAKLATSQGMVPSFEYFNASMVDLKALLLARPIWLWLKVLFAVLLIVGCLFLFFLNGFQKIRRSPPISSPVISVKLPSTWNVDSIGKSLEIAYGSGGNILQYAALQLDSSQLRLKYGQGCVWGTSVFLLPCFWSAGAYNQGSSITIGTVKVHRGDQVIPFSGSISGLQVEGNVQIKPPANDSIQAIVTITNVAGNIPLVERPNEAFKPVMLRSMHFNSSHWATCEAFVGSQRFPIPQSGWIMKSPVSDQTFGLKGGTSTSKTITPSVEIHFNESLPVTGWVSTSSSIDDQNVAFWCASNKILRSWQYTITVSKP